ncbi:MAG: SDR family NAD(P)-dependent oxidoreductase, partial [Comamonadaceae bacterium]
MEDLQGKTALVTGASTGIGAAVAIAFAARGMRVAVHYNSSADAANAVVETIRDAGGSAFALKADVRDTAAIHGAVALTIAEFGHIDVLVNNAGSLVKRVPIAEFDDALFDEVMHINARSVIAFCRHVVPLMRTHGQGGSIINVSSVAARTGGGPGAYLYAGSKGFVSTATHGL